MADYDDPLSGTMWGAIRETDRRNQERNQRAIEDCKRSANAAQAAREAAHVPLPLSPQSPWPAPQPKTQTVKPVVTKLTIPKRPTRRQKRLERAYELSRQADSLSQEGKTLAALRVYTKAIRLNPRLHGMCYRNRAYAYRELNRPKDAIKDMGRALRVEPELAWLFYEDRGNFRMQVGDYQGAFEDFHRAGGSDPSPRLVKRQEEAHGLCAEHRQARAAARKKVIARGLHWIRWLGGVLPR